MSSLKGKRIKQGEQDSIERRSNFKEVSLGYKEEEAICEAKRCLNCKKPNCVLGCPVSVDIPSFLSYVKEGDFASAFYEVSKYNSLPAICGRVCPQESQCEGNCVLGIKGESVAIGNLERFVADFARKNKISPNKKEGEKSFKEKVAVIGSGPAGLSCAGELAKRGYEVTIFEALHEAGGVLLYGIPEFRLPKEEVLKYEIEEIESLGVKIEKNVVVGKTIDLSDLIEEEGFKAIFIGSGAGLPKFMGIKGENSNGVFSANELLTRVNLMQAFKEESFTPINLGKEVAVVGGGNVAMDAARTALRLGAKTHIIYRRSEKELPARLEEVHHAKEEGVIFDVLTNPKEILCDEKGWVTGIKCVKMELGEEDSSGRRRPIEVENSEFLLKVDSVIMSLGTSPNPLLLQSTKGLKGDKRGCLLVEEETLKTSLEGVYAGGDAVTGAATVILAMGAGKKAAKAIDEYLREKEELKKGLEENK